MGSVLGSFGAFWGKSGPFIPVTNSQKIPKKAKKRKKCFFSANSPRNILIFWETANFYVLLKEQSKPGKLHTLGVEFALGEVCMAVCDSLWSFWQSVAVCDNLWHSVAVCCRLW